MTTVLEFSTLASAPAGALDQVLDDVLHGVDVAGLTETNTTANTKALDRTGFELVRGRGEQGANECAILVRRSTKRVVKTWSHQVTDLQFRVGHVVRNGVWSITVLTEDVETGELELFSQLHTPSDFRKRARIWHAAIAGWAKHLQDIHDEVGQHPTAAMADFNRHLLAAAVREDLQKAFPEFTLTWAEHKPRRGTHGPVRVIDGVLVFGYGVDGAQVLARRKPFDHKPTIHHLTPKEVPTVVTYNRITWLPKVLCDVGLTVILEDGWRERGLSTSRPFDPEAFVWHHDASAKGDSPGVPAAMIRAFATAAAQCWVCAGCNGAHAVGAWHILASGRAPHAGEVLPGKPDNETSVGVETDHTSGEDWEPEMLRSLRLGTAAALEHLNVPTSKGLEFHKSICSPPGRKIDPDGLDLGAERARVERIRTANDQPEPTRVTEARVHLDKALDLLNETPAMRRKVKLLLPELDGFIDKLPKR